MVALSQSPPCWYACQHHSLLKRHKIPAFTAAARLDLFSSPLIMGSLLPLSRNPMFLLDCRISLSPSSIIYCNRGLADTVFYLQLIQKCPIILPGASPLFPLISFVIRPFFQRRWGKLTSATSTITSVDTFWRWWWLLQLYFDSLTRNAIIYSWKNLLLICFNICFKFVSFLPTSLASDSFIKSFMSLFFLLTLGP